MANAKIDENYEDQWQDQKCDWAWYFRNDKEEAAPVVKIDAREPHKVHGFYLDDIWLDASSLIKP